MTELVDKQWNKQYQKLIEFKRSNGNCIVPRVCKEDMSLGSWVNNQRTAHSKNKLRLDRKGLLDEIGFVWKAPGVATNNKNWHQQYEKLVEFKRKQGNCVVPQKYEEDASLGTWVDNQRTAHTKNNMRLDRKGLLDEIGFVWRVDKDALWNKQYEKLVEFKRNNGNCLVPRTYKEDASLGTWVNTQRQFHTKKTIRTDRKKLLDEIGFAWKVYRSSTTDVSYR
jgi:hypothetical protein